MAERKRLNKPEPGTPRKRKSKRRRLEPDKSAGHVCFYGDHEFYVARHGLTVVLYKTPITVPVDFDHGVRMPASMIVTGVNMVTQIMRRLREACGHVEPCPLVDEAAADLEVAITDMLSRNRQIHRTPPQDEEVLVRRKRSLATPDASQPAKGGRRQRRRLSEASNGKAPRKRKRLTDLADNTKSGRKRKRLRKRLS